MAAGVIVAGYVLFTGPFDAGGDRHGGGHRREPPGPARGGREPRCQGQGDLAASVTENSERQRGNPGAGGTAWLISVMATATPVALVVVEESCSFGSSQRGGMAVNRRGLSEVGRGVLGDLQKR